MSEVFIVGCARTPMGSFRGALSSLTGPQLASMAMKEALVRSGCSAQDVGEVYLGCCLQAGMGQAPDRQAALSAGIPETVPCTLVNKVCASGMKSITVAAQSLSLGDNATGVAVAGGFESMSNVPFYLGRGEPTYGGTRLEDGVTRDGLLDGTIGKHMVECAENTAAKMRFTREEQDAYCRESYVRAASAYDSGLIQKELFPLTVAKGRNGSVVVEEDEEVRKFNPDAIDRSRPLFNAEGTGTVTPWNSAKIGDGAAACVLMTASAMERLGCNPLAKIVGYCDAAVAPLDYPVSPAAATDRLLQKTGVKADEIDLWEINEATSVVVLANMAISKLDHGRVNVHGGAVSLGHPFGASGARITQRLCHALLPGQVGVASICNGGGGSSAIMIKKM